jgi:hypothetical protein
LLYPVRHEYVEAFGIVIYIVKHYFAARAEYIDDPFLIEHLVK